MQGKRVIEVAETRWLFSSWISRSNRRAHGIRWRGNIRNALLKGVAVFFAVVMLYSNVGAQTDKKDLWIGELWHEDEDIPSGGWERSYVWPGNRWRERIPGEVKMMNATARMAGITFGLKDWTDRRKRHHPYVVGGVASSLAIHPPGLFACYPLEFELVLRRKPPVVFVDGVEQPPRQHYDRLDPNLVSDAMLRIRWSFQVGITMEQRFYAYACPIADDYMYVEFIATNDGNADAKPHDRPELPNQDLHDVCFTYSTQPLVGYEGANQNLAVWENCNDDWVEYYGENYLDYIGSGTPLNPAGDPNADSLRLWIVWDGDNGKIAGDDVGDPDENRGFLEQTPGHGTILSPQYMGFGWLHADKSAEDETNDLSQPFATVWRPGDKRFVTVEEAYKFFFEGAEGYHMLSPQEMGFTEPNDPVNVARPNPYLCVGPYEMPWQSDVRFVMLVAVNGLNIDMCNWVGHQYWEWLHGGEGLTAEEKDWWVGTGRDSLFKVFSAGTRRYFRNLAVGRDPFDVPDPPPPPDTVWVESSERSVLLRWTDVSDVPDPDTGVRDFAGYRVYRAQGRNDTTFTLVWECGGTSGVPVQTSFRDTTVQRGFAYYYYVTSYDDGSQNWEHPGESLESGKYWTMMWKNTPVHPYLTRRPVKNLSGVKVVPNPFNDRSVKLNFPGEPTKLLFVGLPPRCEIRVYTVNGDLVKVLHHDDGTSEEPWNQVTDWNQIIHSGVYVYYVHSDMGDAVGKFVVIRRTAEE